MAFYCSAAILQGQEPLKKPIHEEERTKTSMKIVVTIAVFDDTCGNLIQLAQQ
jgi:hypothetical protein